MNFSASNVWNYSLSFRYPIDKIKKIDNIYFVDNKGKLECHNFFDLDFSNYNFLSISKVIKEEDKIIEFKYINNATFNNIRIFAEKNNLKININDEWDAPVLETKLTLQDYILKCNNQIRRNYRMYTKSKHNYKFYNSSTSDVLKLWSYVLKIDFNSWKYDEKSDMKSLNREDLQYFPFLVINKNLSSLIVMCDRFDNPLAYSLMFKGLDYWYQTKWGSSSEGRKIYAGFYALFNHLEYIRSIENCIKVDFWGRRNSTYDSLKNDFIKRYHFEISRM